jgi:SAM-dependent methyltransferase
MSRNTVKVVLRRTGLLPVAFRMHERVKALAGDGRSITVDDGLPLPPAALRTRVAGTANAEWFLSSGRTHAAAIREIMAGVGSPLESAAGILDFGCGCGRVVRRWRDLGARVHGADHDEPAVAWCRENLPFASFTVNDLAPPLSYDDDSFDLVYAISVFTHTPSELQLPWLEELTRVVRPGGHVLLTTHGDWCAAAKLTPDELREFEEGALVVRDEGAGGTNLCAAFHPPSYFRAALDGDLVEAFFRPGGEDPFDQDIWVLRKKR